MKLRSDVFAALAVTAGIALAIQGGPEAATPTVGKTAVSHEAVSFASEVMPLMEKYCWECHSVDNAELGLMLDTYEGVMAGSDYGTVVEVGDPDGSLLVDMIASGDMPEDSDPMPAEELELIRTWIAEGAENN
jgi:hypothetical protein